MKHFRNLYFLFFSLLIGCKTEEPQNPPSVVTNIASEVQLKSAKLTGEVLDEGFSAASERGFVYSDKNPNPSVSDNKISSGYGKGIFESTISNLTPNTLYYFKSFATNTKGTSYGLTQNFTTADYRLPTIETELAKNISYTSFELIGNIKDEGGGSVSESGFVLSKNPSPTISDMKFPVSKGKTTIALVVISLNANTRYYFRTYAINEKGIAYGNEQIATTLDVKSPTISTGSISELTNISCRASGNLIEDGGSQIIEMGFCVSENLNPTISDLVYKSPIQNGEYTQLISNLKVNTNYYLKSYAKNIKGITYGNQVQFQTKNDTQLGLSSLNENLNLYLPFNGNSNDISSYAAKGTVLGASLTSDRNGNLNSAYSFDGLNSQIYFANKTQFNFGTETNFSISLWINLDTWSGKGFEGILTKGSGILMYQLGRYGNRVSAEYGNPALMWFSSLETPNNLSLNKWYSMIMTVNRQTNLIKLFIDGVLVKSYFDERVSTQNITSSDPLRIGTERNSNNYFHGKLDDIGIWSKELSLAEIKYLSTN